MSTIEKYTTSDNKAIIFFCIVVLGVIAACAGLKTLSLNGERDRVCRIGKGLLNFYYYQTGDAKRFLELAEKVGGYPEEKLQRFKEAIAIMTDSMDDRGESPYEDLSESDIDGMNEAYDNYLEGAVREMIAPVLNKAPGTETESDLQAWATTLQHRSKLIPDSRKELIELAKEYNNDIANSWVAKAAGRKPLAVPKPEK